MPASSSFIARPVLLMCEISEGYAPLRTGRLLLLVDESFLTPGRNSEEEEMEAGGLLRRSSDCSIILCSRLLFFLVRALPIFESIPFFNEPRESLREDAATAAAAASGSLLS